MVKISVEGVEFQCLKNSKSNYYDNSSLHTGRLMIQLFKDKMGQCMWSNESLTEDDIKCIKDICSDKKKAFLNLKNDKGIIAELSMLKLRMFDDINIPFVDHIGNANIRDLDNSILILCAKGHKIQAIKLYRTQTGYGLKDSKDYVEALWSNSEQYKIQMKENMIRAMQR